MFHEIKYARSLYLGGCIASIVLLPSCKERRAELSNIISENSAPSEASINANDGSDDLELLAKQIENIWIKSGTGYDRQKLIKVLSDLLDSDQTYKFVECLENPELIAEVGRIIGELAYQNRIPVHSYHLVDHRKVSRQAFNLGWHYAWMKVSPDSAVESFVKDALKEGYLDKVTYLLCDLPAGTNRERIDNLFPRDERNIAVSCRRSLYSNWAKNDFSGLLTYLTSKSYYDQSFTEVLLEWRNQDSDSADQWVRSVVDDGNDNPAWDVALLYQIKLEVDKGLFASAWDKIELLNSPRYRGKLATQTHAKWAKVDYKAAESARKSYQTKYPPKDKKNNAK